MKKVHDYEDRPKTTEEERRRLHAKLPTGKKNAVTSGKLAKLMGWSPSQTNEKIRALCKELLIFDGVPVCSCSRGFFLGNQEEIMEYIGNLQTRKMGLERGIRALFQLAEDDQASLF